MLVRREDGSFRPELREDVLKDRETLAAADHLLTQVLIAHSPLSAGQIESLSVTEKLETVRGAADGGG